MRKVNIGDVFEKWEVISESYERTKSRSKKFLCRCKCGAEKVVAAQNLLNGTSKSCGCTRKPSESFIGRKHNQTGTRLYNIWKNMKGRCYRESSTHWDRYGGRGISVCDEWKNSFENFMQWANCNGYQDNLTIDRIDEDGNYEPLNCQWISNRDNVSKANKRHLLNKTGGQSEESKQKTKISNREVLGIKCKLVDSSGSDFGLFDSIGHAAEKLSEITGRKFSSVYSQLKQIYHGKCKTLAGYKLEVL